jgi:hypothetical protein
MDFWGQPGEGFGQVALEGFVEEGPTAKDTINNFAGESQIPGIQLQGTCL